MYDFQRKHGYDIDCHVLAPASTWSNTRASTCITTPASMVLNGASTCSNTCASTCITTRASTCITTRASTCPYTRARLLFKNMPPGCVLGNINWFKVQIWGGIWKKYCLTVAFLSWHSEDAVTSIFSPPRHPCMRLASWRLQAHWTVQQWQLSCKYYDSK